LRIAWTQTSGLSHTLSGIGQVCKNS